MSARLISNNQGALPDYTLKVVIVGEPYVGKSSILDVVAGKTMIGNREPTIGMEFYLLHAIGDPDEQMEQMKQMKQMEQMEQMEKMKALLNEGHDPRKVPTHYDVQIWDCAGQVRFRSIVKSYFRQAHVVMAVFNLTDHESFEMIEVWVKEIRNHFPIDAKIILGLIGNKMDLVAERQVTDQEAERLAESLNLDFYFPVSALSGTNLQKVFDQALSIAHQRVLNCEIKLKHRTDLDRFATSDRGGGIRTLRTHGSPPRVRCSDCF